MIHPPLSRTPAQRRLFLWFLGSFFLLAAWDCSGLDLWMAYWFGSAGGFAFENHWLWRDVLHNAMRLPPWLFELGLLVAIIRPFGAIRHLQILRRLQLALTTLVALALVSGIKLHSHTSCPWDLQQFGGVASHVSHWAWGRRDGGGGGCFPAGHASAGFAFIGGFFAFRQVLPGTARRWLAAAMLTGFLLGFAQQVRGAHYMSHTLWTAWFCWAAAALVDLGVSRLISHKPSRAQAQLPGLPGLRPTLRPE